MRSYMNYMIGSLTLSLMVAMLGIKLEGMYILCSALIAVGCIYLIPKIKDQIAGVTVLCLSAVAFGVTVSSVVDMSKYDLVLFVAGSVIFMTMYSIGRTTYSFVNYDNEILPAIISIVLVIIIQTVAKLGGAETITFILKVLLSYTILTRISAATIVSLRYNRPSHEFAVNYVYPLTLFIIVCSF